MVTFVIPAHNEARFIGATLSALRAAARDVGAPHEIIVVDDDSSDGTAAVAALHGARIVQVACRHIAATRNAGAKQAQGKYLLFVDADTIVNAAVVAAALRELHEGAVGGGVIARFDGYIPLYARPLGWVYAWLFRLARWGTGCFFFCQREDFEGVGGFDETLYAFEDVALCRALQRRGRFVILGESVVTSGRNLRAHSAGDALRMLRGLALQGPKFFQSRAGAYFWYRGRHDDA